MKILVINAGSSSLKYQLINAESERVMAKGIIERIGMERSTLKHHAEGNENLEIENKVFDHIDAVKIVLDVLIDKKYGVISDMKEISFVGHRIVHGGEKFSSSVVIDDKVIAALREYVELAPLHNPANIMGIEACRKTMPHVQMAGVFDTAYHQTMPPKAFLYGIPIEAYEKYKIRRYGFHGTSHKYVATRIAEVLRTDICKLKIITCHLGNGSSIAAIKNGKIVDTSMGFTPLEGLVMGTRSGDIDPSVIQHLMSRINMTLEETMEYLNKKSGVLGISGISSDFRDIQIAADTGDKYAKLAIEVFCYRVKKYIGAYIAIMGGVDVIAFTAGIGENSPRIREMIIDGMDFMDTRIDHERNISSGAERIISTPNSKVTVMIIPTNEELMIARETKALFSSH